ncbi:nicotinate (nicotinamide) nucleotide adenylyltransferase [Mesonia aestuariivivens]|uniref:Probable nicotinate-nucleotide adenylyltransferase n=1 Tax=Mesonia aestuariivivens TaxID=2796128 RepID=A0ABS6VZE2_9FLAO|nr:nicotinate (nicotinamide) nucleotide adenylyltransferase [Mesonia aestuariivivens]MBW2960268.1 nicotinate-nucleotide adenylyltransferase [Mesonia aestuariivivens]
MQKKIGLYFGTFNPVHMGHLAIANHMVEFSDLDEVWMVVTPLNPLKKKRTLLEDHHRLEMVYLATEDYDHIQPSNIEFGLPQPNYTVNTLAHLEEKYPEYNFALIMGEDNLNTLHKWKNHEVILERFEVFVYPRITSAVLKDEFQNHPKITKLDAPIMEISSTFIRNAVKNGKRITPLLPHKVWEYIDEMNFYKL